jgi:ADP-ribose pyrophosphatase YjhB (NUDIX family)
MTGALVAAGALFVDAAERVLIVEPTYKKSWEIPGGHVEAGETPQEGCVRELREELGLDLAPGALLVVDWAPREGVDRVLFVFDGGALDDRQVGTIRLPSDELASWAYVPPEELASRLAPWLHRRAVAALGARAAGETWYLEYGVRAG